MELGFVTLAKGNSDFIRRVGVPLAESKATEDLFHNRKTSRVRRYPPEILRPGLQLLDVLNAAQELRDLRSPPGNHLELMRGEYKGFHSIRINRQWRVMFRWRTGEAREVRITDYHRG